MSGGGILSNLPDLAGNTLANSAGITVVKSQPQEIKNEVTFNTTVKNDKDLDKMFEKADNWFAQRGRELNLGIGRR
ncbi:hypothetical protein IIU_01552 [Bacillus cereus VD133]|uniref:Phage tail tape measure protein, TP901 family, core region n=1 Tax=Bacillus cereus VD133 TaxID=1053233 RepID=A0A9W5PUZ7_BACCE|nr:hypothetical protein [Bacillus cereus]EOO36949.1 hypothetical protein IIU_01552 [Bacillus cereus VD133]